MHAVAGRIRLKFTSALSPTRIALPAQRVDVLFRRDSARQSGASIDCLQAMMSAPITSLCDILRNSFRQLISRDPRQGQAMTVNSCCADYRVRSYVVDRRTMASAAPMVSYFCTVGTVDLNNVTLHARAEENATEGKFICVGPDRGNRSRYKAMRQRQCSIISF